MKATIAVIAILSAFSALFAQGVIYPSSYDKAPKKALFRSFLYYMSKHDQLTKDEVVLGRYCEWGDKGVVNVMKLVKIEDDDVNDPKCYIRCVNAHGDTFGALLESRRHIGSWLMWDVKSKLDSFATGQVPLKVIKIGTYRGRKHHQLHPVFSLDLDYYLNLLSKN